MEATKEKRKVKVGDEVRYHERICKITYIQPDGSVNLTAFKGAPFNSKFTPVADLEFPNDDGVFGEVDSSRLDVVPTVIVAPQKPATRKLEIKPKSATDQTIIFPMSKIEAQSLVNQIRAGMNAVGQKILQFYEHEGWKPLGYSSWRECVTAEFDFSQSRAYQLLEAAKVERNISTIGGNLPVPTSERQTRPLVGLEPEQQIEVYASAVEKNNGEVPSGAQVEAAVAELTVTPTRSLVDNDGEILNREVPETIAAETAGRQKPKSNAKGEHEDDQPDPRDRCQTPDYAVDPLLPFLRNEWVIFEPAYGDGLLAEALFDGGIESLVSGDLLTGQDFLKTTTAHEFDVIVTNPPFSTKYAWIERCYALGKPFALLMPVETLGAKTAQDMFREHGIEIIFMNQRIDFKMPNKGWGGSAQFPSAWFCWGLELGQQMIFADISVAKKAFVDGLSESDD